MNIQKKFPAALALLFIITTTITFCSGRLIIGPNDGSQFALTSAIALEKRFSIQSFTSFTKHIDYAFRDGNFYSDRQIGLSLISVPGMLVSEMFTPPSEDPELNQKKSVLLTQSIIGSLNVVLIVLILKQMGCSSVISLLTGFVFAFCSLNWKYSGIYMSHGLSGFVVLLAFYLALLKQFSEKSSLHYLLAFTIGFIPLTRYEVVLLTPFLIGLFFVNLVRNKQNRSVTYYLNLISVFLLPVLILAFYHTICFGNPFETYAAFYSPHSNFWLDDVKLSKGGGFTIPNMHSNKFLKGLNLIYFGWPDFTKAWGFFTLQPVLVFAIPGLYYLAKKDKLNFLFIFASIVVLTIFSAKNLSIAGGAMKDPRYMFPVLPLFYISIGFYLNHISQKKYYPIVLCIFSFIASISCIICAVHFIDSDNTYYDWENQKQIILSGSPLSYASILTFLNSLFPLWSNWYLPIVIIITILLISFLLKLLLSRITFIKPTLFNFLVFLTNFCLMALIGYGINNPRNYFNTFSDTLRVDSFRISHTAQEFSFPHYNLTIGEVPSATVNGKSCEGGITTKSRSSMTFITGEKPLSFNFFVGLSDQNIWLDLEDSKTIYSVKVNGNNFWESEEIFKDSGIATASLQIPANSKVELISISDGNRKFLKSIWCDLKLEETTL